MLIENSVDDFIVKVDIKVIFSKKEDFDVGEAILYSFFIDI